MKPKRWTPITSHRTYYSILREITKAERADKNYWQKDAERLAVIQQNNSDTGDNK